MKCERARARGSCRIACALSFPFNRPVLGFKHKKSASYVVFKCHLITAKFLYLDTLYAAPPFVLSHKTSIIKHVWRKKKTTFKGSARGSTLGLGISELKSGYVLLICFLIKSLHIEPCVARKNRYFLK